MRYFYANGGIYPFEQSEEGLTVPQWAMALYSDEESDFRALSDEENDEYARQQGIKDRGFDMSAARWAGNEQAMVENPATGQVELIVNTPQGPMLTSQAAAAGIAGTPLMKPAEESTLSQFADFGGTLAQLAAAGAGAYGLGSLLGGGLAGAGQLGASVADGIGASEVASYTAPELGMGGAQGLQIGGGGLGLQAPVTGNLAAMGGAQGLVAPAGTSFAGAAIPAAVGAAGAAGSVLGGTGGATTLANAGLGATAAGAGGAAATGGTALSRLTGIDPDVLSVAGQVAGAGLGAYASNQQSGALTDMANKYLEYGAPSRARYEASMSPGFNPSSIPGYQGAVDNSMQTMLRKLSTQGNPFGNPGGLIEANKSVVAGTALPALQEYQRLNAGTGGIASLNAAAPSTSAAATGANANIYNAIGYGIDQATAQPSTLDSLLKRLASKSTPNYGLA